MLLYILLLNPFLFLHDVAMATFHLNQEDGFITLELEIDREDVEAIYQKQNDKIADLREQEQFVQAFVNQHFYLVINERKINFNVEVITKSTFFYTIELASQHKLEEDIQRIQVKNTCLIEEVKKHSNVMNFHFNDKFRSFRMHKGRKRIEVKY